MIVKLTGNRAHPIHSPGQGFHAHKQGVFSQNTDTYSLLLITCDLEMQSVTLIDS